MKRNHSRRLVIVGLVILGLIGAARKLREPRDANA
jgi:hypothetical protein